VYDHGLGLAVVDGNGLPGEVDEHLLAGNVVLPQHHVEVTPPGVIQPAKLAVLVTAGMLLQILPVEQLQGDALVSQLVLHARPIRHRTRNRRRRRGHEHAPLQFAVVDVQWQRPRREPGRGGSLPVVIDGRGRHASGLADMPTRQPLAER
jgi:hypothetical protein